MSKTKFTKVAVSERLPSEQGTYMVIFKDNKVGTFNFWNEEGFIDSWKEDVDFWLEESPDREDEMIDMLVELVELKRIKDLDGKTPYYLERQPKVWEKAKSLLQSLKQEK